MSVSTAAATTGNGTLSKKYPIVSLPLVPKSSRLTNNLLPDPLTPTPASLLSVPASSPTLLRRSRGVGEGSHFSYVTPLVMEFPYDLEKNAKEEEVDPEPSDEDRRKEREKFDAMDTPQKREYAMKKQREGMERMEKMMRPYEVQPDSGDGSSGSTSKQNGDHSSTEDRLSAFLPPAKTRQAYPSARLLGISSACMRDCLPHLDVGDASEWISSRSGKDNPDCYSSGPMAKQPSQDDQAAFARHQLSDYLSGRLIGAQFPSLASTEIDEGAEPGVGEAQQQRMARIADEEDSEDATHRWTRRSAALEKRRNASSTSIWSGYAPWSNAYSGHQFGVWAGQLGDGRAISLMETINPTNNQRWEVQLKGAGRTPYSRFADGLATLASSVREFLASEALSALQIPTSRALSVISIKDVAVVRERRVSSAVTSRLAPIWTRIGSFEHHSQRKEWESVRMLGEFVCKEGYGWKDVGDQQQQPWAERLLRECSTRNAKMIARWQVQGFMHGVMNTDNISLLGITIDFGPYAFMDIFDQNQICNKSDGTGRYTYRMQPTMGMFAIEKLATSLSPLIGFERKNKRSAQPGELVQLSDDDLETLSEEGQESVWDSVKDEFMDTLIKEWLEGWRHRLALKTSKPDDRDSLVDPLMAILEDCDFTISLRALGNITEYLDRPDEFAKQWLDLGRVQEFEKERRREMVLSWVQTYTARLKEEGQSPESLRNHLLAANPAFVLRNWVTDEVTKRLEEKDDTDFLETVLQLCLHPYDEPKTDEGKRLCTVGTLLNGNMPSCSS